MHNQENQNGQENEQNNMFRKDFNHLSHWEESLTKRKTQLETIIEEFFSADNPFESMHDLFAAYLEVSEDENSRTRANTCYAYSSMLLFFSKLRENQNELRHCREQVKRLQVQMN